MLFWIVIVGILFGNAFWWRWADRRARTLPGSRWWRLGIGLFCAFQYAYLVLFFVAPTYARRPHPWMPAPALAGFYIWNLLGLPITLVTMGLIRLVQVIAKVSQAGEREDTHADEVAEATPPLGADASDAIKLTRRQWIGATALMLPPLLSAGATARGLMQLGDLRVRALEVPIAGLPPELNGLTIAQVTDVHIGRFTKRAALTNIIETTNRLRADLVLMTGDLIDLSLSDFPAGVDLINRLDPRQGLLMVEGNHDLIESPREFERRSRIANLPILFNETRTLNIRGVPIQFLGIRWGREMDGRRRSSNNSIIRDSVETVLAQRDPAAFPILLAHHPHAFDSAIEAKIPLTFAGHTHGGQLMLTERLGAGPVMFKYWSGLYRNGNSSLVVSNGAGNWFPLRVNAPAEIVHVTLRSA